MIKLSKILLPLVVFSTLMINTSCGTSGSEQSEITSTSEKKDDSEVGVLKNYISDLNLKGYIGTNLKNNIKFWQATAYQENPNIIGQIKEANETTEGGFNFASVLGPDYFGVDNYYDLDIVEKDAVKQIGWRLKYLPGSYGDRDIRFVNDPAAITAWPGAKELWISVDASEIPSSVGLRVCFEDDSSGRESFNLIKGKQILVYNNGEEVTLTVEDNGYITLPALFKGYVTLPLDLDHYQSYWSEGGNGQIDFGCIAQFQMAVRGDGQMVGKTLYMKDFAIVGNVNGQTLPVTKETTDTYKIVWSMDGLTKRNNSSQASSLPWYGEFVGKLLTGIAYSYRAEPDELLVNAADEIIDALEEAQGKDGYLGVFKGAARFSIGISNWDLWNHYHCIVGLLEWYKNSGNEKALSIAKKAIDCIYETFKNRSYLVAGGFETNRGIAHGYAMMYQITKEEKYLNEAERIIKQDCQDANGWYKGALNGISFYRTSSARWEVLHMILTLGILYEETENEEYYTVMEKIWYDILRTDVHNDGGFTTNEGAIGDSYAEGVIETCCTIAWSAFTNEFLKYSLSVEVADELERSYFNALLGSLLDNDRNCTYNTPVNGIQGTAGGYDGRRVKSQQDISFQFNSGSPDMNCCQANFARGIGQIAEWACLTDGNALYLNYFGNSEIVTKVDNKAVTIKETTTYPVNGNVKLTISGLSEPTKFKLKLRIPSWSIDSTVAYGGKTYNAPSNEYFEINKTWNNGDEVELNIGIGFTGWKGERTQAKYTSIYYGPILLAMDQYYLNKFNPSFTFDRSVIIDAYNFEDAEITSGTSQGAWLFVDVETTKGTLRLVDFASAGKYNGGANPSSYYSWLNVGNGPEKAIEFVNRWKEPLF